MIRTSTKKNQQAELNLKGETMHLMSMSNVHVCVHRLVQAGVQLGDIVIPLGLVEVACHRSAQPVLGDNVLGLGVVPALASQPNLRVSGGDPTGRLLEDCKALARRQFGKADLFTHISCREGERYKTGSAHISGCVVDGSNVLLSNLYQEDSINGKLEM